MGLFDDTAAKVMLATTPGDSIRGISQKIDGTYSWVHTWVTRLEDAGFLSRDNGIQITNYDVREQYNRMMAALARGTSPSIDEAYIIPHFAGLPFAYTKIDAVYTWTHGGYQIARGANDYPIFIQVNDYQIEQWIAFFNRYGIPTTITKRATPDDHDSAVYYVLFPTSTDVEREWVDGNPVISLDETIDHMMEYRVNYEPALEMIANEYDRDINAEHDDSRLQA